MDKRTKNLFFSSIVYILLGIVLLIFSNVYNANIINQVTFALGLFSIVVGGIVDIVYFAGKKYLSSKTLDFTIGTFLFFLGIYITLSNIEFDKIFSILIALAVLFDSVFKVNIGIEQWKLKNKFWWIFALLGAIVIIACFIILVYPLKCSDETKNMCTYILLTSDGIINLLVCIYIKFSKHKS